MIDDDNERKKKKICTWMLMIAYQLTSWSAQSPQLRESEPTFWILNAEPGIRAAASRSPGRAPSGGASPGCSSPSASTPISPESGSVPGSRVTAARVIGRPRARALPPRTMRTLRVGHRISSSNSWDAEADAELATDCRSMSSDPCGERVRVRR